MRSDIQNAREIFVGQTRAGLQAALDSGVILPAVALAVRSPSFFSKQSDNPQREP